MALLFRSATSGAGRHDVLIREIENPSASDFLHLFRNDHSDQELTRRHEGRFRNTGSGKGALALVLMHLAKTGCLSDKTSEVLVADWIGYWVYNQIQPYAFPTKNLTKRTKAVVVYHQYGFPQNMDAILEFAQENKLAVIEDCAHAVASEYRGRPLGTIGDYAIYSFSKFVFCLALGGAASREVNFITFADQVLANSARTQTFIKDSAKLVYECVASVTKAPQSIEQVSRHFLNASYALYGNALLPARAAIQLCESKLASEIAIRKKRYKLFREQTSHYGICDHLEEDGVTPYVIPIQSDSFTQQRILARIKDRGVTTGIYRFDMNRNFLNPRFEPVVWIPCHSQISEALYETLIQDVLDCLKNGKGR